MDEIKKEALNEEQLSNVSGGINVSDISLPSEIISGLNPAESPAEALAISAQNLAASMGQAMHNATEAQGGMSSLAAGMAWDVPGSKP